MIDGEPPYNNESEEEILKLIERNGKPSVTENSKVKSTPDILDFIDRCLEINPDKRADTKELLNHSFINRAASLTLLESNVKV